jgi:hypothetical protein
MYTLTDARVEVGYDGSKRDDEKLEGLPPVRPILWVERGVGGLRPEHLRAILSQLETRSDGFAQFNLRFPVICQAS